MSNYTTFEKNHLAITRITNACLLIEFGKHAILTDPWFKKPWGFTEEPGMQVSDLPPLTAIIGSHFAPDHWGISALKEFPAQNDLAVFTATNGMANQAKKFGFSSAEKLSWGERRELVPGLELEVAEAHSFFGRHSNNYILSDGRIRIFFGGEIKKLEPLKSYSQKNDAIDVLLAPVNGMRLLGYKLVTTADEALQAATILGAKTLIPIHDSMHSMGFGGPSSSGEELLNRDDIDTTVLFLEAGIRTQVI